MSDTLMYWHALLDGCAHTEIIALPPDPRFTAEMAYQCSHCGKKVAVPYDTIREQGQSCIANIIRLAFEPGEKRLGDISRE